MEINHQTFGKLKYNYGWTKDISLDIFNKQLDEIVKKTDSTIISYCNREISDFVSSYTNNNEKNIF